MYLEVLKQEERYGWCFRRLNDSRKGTYDAFSGYKLTSQVSVLSLEVKLQQKKVRLMHSVLKYCKNGRNKVFREKQPTSKVSLLFLGTVNR